MVAIGLGPVSASVEMATEGVEYDSWSEFKQAVLGKANLTEEFYSTSQGEEIDSKDPCGRLSVDDCSFPFKRMETIDHRGSKIVAWNGNVMTVRRHGTIITYDFNNWTSSTSIDTDTSPPAAPGGIGAAVN